jgi:hypothetical protein
MIRISYANFALAEAVLVQEVNQGGDGVSLELFIAQGIELDQSDLTRIANLWTANQSLQVLAWRSLEIQ